MPNAMPNLRILVPLDGSERAEESLRHAAGLADVFASELLLLRVVGSSRDERGHDVDSIDWQLRQRQASAYLEQVSERLRELGTNSRSYVESGSPARTIVRFAKEKQVDLVVISRMGQTGGSQFGDGSVSRKVVAATDSSILLVGNPIDNNKEGKKKYGKIVVPVDDSQGAEWAVALAASIATMHDSRLSLVRILESPCHDIRLPATSETKVLLDRVRQLGQIQAACRFSELRSHVPITVDVTTETLCAEGVSSEIAQYGVDKDADLLIVCAHGTSGCHPWRYGSVAESLLAHGTIPVLVFQQGNTASAQHYRNHYCDGGKRQAS